MYYILDDFGIIAEFKTEEEVMAWFDNHKDLEDVWYCYEE